MSEEFPAFSLAERDRRWNAARRILEARGMDCLIVFGNDRFPISTYFSNDRIDMIVIFPRRGERRWRRRRKRARCPCRAC